MFYRRYMGIADNYGEFEVPEEKSVIEVVSDSLKEILSCQELFKKIADKKLEGHHFLSYAHTHILSQLHKDCKKIFEGKQKLKPNEEEIKEIIKAVRKTAKSYDGSGVFLTEMLNETGIDKLIIEPFPLHEKYKEPITIEHLGYCLKKNKLVIITKNTRMSNLGENSEGNIINNGQVYQEMGEGAENGIQINYGHVRSLGFQNEGAIAINNSSTEFFGCLATGGIHINNKKSEYISSATMGGIHINQGSAERMGHSAQGGIHINNAFLDYFGPYAIRGILIKNKGTAWRKYSNPEDICIELDNKTEKRKQLQQKLDLKLAEIEFTKNLESLCCEKQIRKVEAYDWKRFEKEITSLAEQIKAEYEK